MLIGGAAGPTLFSHIAEFGDGWMPIGGAGMSAELDRLREAMAESGREANELHIVPMGVLPTDDKLAYFEESGVTEAVLRLPASSDAEVLAVLDEYTRYAERFMP